MLILTLDTSASACTVALDRDGQITVRSIDEPRAHAQRLLPLMQQLCAAENLQLQQLDALAVIAGPGSFTGLRIGMGVIQGLAYATGKPVVLLSSLAALAQSVLTGHTLRNVLVVMQARDGEIYYGGYSRGPDGMVLAVVDDAVGPPAQLLWPQAWSRNDPYLAAGDGWHDEAALVRALGAAPSQRSSETNLQMAAVCPLVRQMVEQGQVVAAELALPRYLKEQMHYRQS